MPANKHSQADAEQAHRIVLVQLRGSSPSAIPDPDETLATAHSLTTQVEALTGGKARAMNVFPRFGQFAVEATPAMIAQFAKAPEVEAVMENDAGGQMLK